MSTPELFRALGSDTRLRLLARLKDSPGATLSDLIAGMDGTRQGLSRHLEVLEEVGLVVVRWEGREKLHYFNPIPLVELTDDWMPRYVTPEARALREVTRQIEASRHESQRNRRA